MLAGIGLVLSFLVRLILVQTLVVPPGHLVPGARPGQRLIVWLPAAHRPLRPGAVVVVRLPERAPVARSGLERVGRRVADGLGLALEESLQVRQVSRCRGGASRDTLCLTGPWPDDPQAVLRSGVVGQVVGVLWPPGGLSTTGQHAARATDAPAVRPAEARRAA